MQKVSSVPYIKKFSLFFLFLIIYVTEDGFYSYFFYPFYRLRNGLKFSRVLELPEVRSVRFDEHVNSSYWAFLKINRVWF